MLVAVVVLRLLCVVSAELRALAEMVVEALVQVVKVLQAQPIRVVVVADRSALEASIIPAELVVLE
jgi:hypothetical protein